MPLNNPSSAGAVIAEGAYTGDDSVNKAIPHGLSLTPKYVRIVCNTNPEYHAIIYGQEAKIYPTVTGAWKAARAVTIPDVTNFYVGNAAEYWETMNEAGSSYYWIALG